jgi:hypothetical protein
LLAPTLLADFVNTTGGKWGDGIPVAAKEPTFRVIDMSPIAPLCINPRWLHGKWNGGSDVVMREVSALEQQGRLRERAGA